MGHGNGTRLTAIEIRGTVNGAPVVAEAGAWAPGDGSEGDLLVETCEDAIGWELALAAPAIVGGVVLAAPLAIDDEDSREMCPPRKPRAGL